MPDQRPTIPPRRPTTPAARGSFPAGPGTPRTRRGGAKPATRWALGIALVLGPAAALAAGGTVVARARAVTTRLTAYARVTPLAVLPVTVPRAGVVSNLTLVPGDPVRAGQELARLRGPEIRALMARRQAAVAAAGASWTAARRTLAIRREKASGHLSTREAVVQAQAAATEARARLDNARSRLQAAQQMAVLRAPGDGRVLSVAAVDGTRLGRGETVLTLQPAHGLWLRAVYYGVSAAAIHPGMHGTFTPADGRTPVAVTVRSVVGALRPDGGQVVGMNAGAAAPGWLNGESGSVTLEGAQRTLVVVPTRALVLDQGKWWVLVHTAHGDRRRAVIPGTSRGESTFIEHGLQPGTPVVVENAYLRFHHELSQHYQAPD